MGLPSYEQFIGPLLQYLVTQQEPVRASNVYDAVAELIELSPEERTEMLPSKVQQVYKNRIGWAQDALKRAGLSTAPKRGSWLITAEGRELLAKYPDGFPDDECGRISRIDRHTPVAKLVGGGSETEVDPQTESPEEKIDSGLQDLRKSVAQDLLEIIERASPLFFENLVLDVLHAMGYGTSRADLKRVGGPGDGGIDGIISLDRLGLEKVYVQAKKWKSQVGSPEIQGFMGALQLQGASKGVLITSGTVSGPAWDAAKQAKGSVVLIDGARLANLMIDHGVGVSNKVLKVPAVDSDYFEDE
jgi:restriction system protein